MTTVAEVLKQERETQGISLEEVAQKTYIKLHYLHALEEDRPDLLPAPVYTCGYIRQYAKLLGLNGADLVNIYQSQHKPREYAIVRNVSPALAPETRTEARTPDLADSDAVQTAVRHEMPIAERPMSASTAAAPIAPAPAAVVPPAVTAPVVPPSVTAPAPNGLTPAAERPRREEAAPPAPTFSAPAAPRPQPAAVPAPVTPPSRPAPVIAETAPQPAAPAMEVRIDTRDTASHPEAEKILMLARQQADEIIAKAREEAARLRQGAEQYADQILSQLETDIGRTLAVIKNGRSHLQTRQRARRTPERVGERTPETSSI